VAGGYESKLDAVVAAAPVYHQTDPQVVRRLGYDPLTATTIIAPPVDAVEAAHALMARGGVAEQPMFYANVPSALDPTMRVGDDHVFSLEVLYTPYALRGGWAGSKEPERWFEHYATLVQPEFLGGMRRWRAMTPDRYETDFHLPRGHVMSFAGGPVAALLGRQPELTRYETPVKGLYLTGAATFPGAGVWGASGRNAATVVLRHTN
jgi:phytoene dehydrogenase-like protein